MLSCFFFFFQNKQNKQNKLNKLNKNFMNWYRLWTVLLGILFGIVLYKLLLKPYTLDKLCITSRDFVIIKYRSYSNSVIIHMQPYGYSIFFDGEKAFVYGLPTSQKCEPSKKNNYVIAYVIDVKFNHIYGFLCVAPIDQVESFYDEKKCPVQYLFVPKPSWDFDVWSILNYLDSQNIININKLSSAQRFQQPV